MRLPFPFPAGLFRTALLSLLLFSLLLPLAAQGREDNEISLPWFGQLEENWGSSSLGDSPVIDIAHGGCALVSTAMVLKHYGVKTDPLKLNKWLLKNGGFDKGWDDDTGEYLGLVRIIWDIVASGHSEIGVYRRYDFTALPADLYLIRGYLDGGIPVIAEVLRPGNIPHFVVLTGYEGDDFLIRDPLDETTRLLSESYRIADRHGSGAARNIFGVRIFVPAE
ncbi:MAG: C39 family peptidase [Spirochaetales bacterium]|nr:C39 family peptidase [Spirochaetales bacterium]